MQDSGVQALLDRLRAKSKSATQQQLPWAEFGRQMRMATLEHKTQRNMPVVQQSMEKLQGVMRAAALSDVLERIEPLCRALKLQYNQKHASVFISSDTFYVELQLDLENPVDFIKDVKVAHGNSAVACPHMIDTLKKCDFVAFQDHLKGFLEMYNIIGDKNLKRKFFIVLQSLESDINNLAQVQSGFSTSANYQALVYRYPLGIYTPRRDGLPLRLTYFLTPYDLVNEQTKEILPFNIDVIKERGVGLSATVGIEQSAGVHQLQTIPLMSITRSAEGKQLPVFAALTSVNSVSLTAVFILKLNKPMPITREILTRMENITAIPVVDKSELRPFMDLVLNRESASACSPSSGKTKEYILYVSLPGQEHGYFVNEPTDDALKHGAFVHEIPFSHPTHVPKVLTLLRQQAALNAVLLSCVRPSAKPEPSSCHRLEVTVVSLNLINVTFEDPLEQSLSTVEFDLSELVHLKCKITSCAMQAFRDDTASKAFQRAFSIPVTMRALLKTDRIKMEVTDSAPGSAAPTRRTAEPAAATAAAGASAAISQQLADYYTARGHYMPFGSLNTVSTAYTKNIQSNQYSLCLRRFAGYRRRPLLRSAMPFRPLVAHCNASDNIQLGASGGGGGGGGGGVPASGAGGGLLQRARGGLPAGSAQSMDEENRASKNPMLASLLDDELGKGRRPPAPGTAGHYPHQHAPILTDLLEGSDPAGGGGGSDAHYHQLQSGAAAVPAAKKAPAARKRRPTAERAGSAGGGSSKRRKKSEGGAGGGSVDGGAPGKETTAASAGAGGRQQQQQQLTVTAAAKSPTAGSVKATVAAAAAAKPQFAPSAKVLSSSLPSQKATALASAAQASGGGGLPPPLSRSAASTVSSNPGLANLLSQSFDADKARCAADATESSGQGCAPTAGSSGAGCPPAAAGSSAGGSRDRPPLRRSSSLASEPDTTPSSGSSRDAAFDDRSQSLLPPPPQYSRDDRPLPGRDEQATELAVATNDDDDAAHDWPESKPPAERKEKANITVKISRPKERRSVDDRPGLSERSLSAAACDVPGSGGRPPEKKHKGSKLTISASLGDVEPASAAAVAAPLRKVRESHSLEIIKTPSSPNKRVDRIKITKAKAKSATPSAAASQQLLPEDVKHKALKKASSSGGGESKAKQGQQGGVGSAFLASGVAAIDDAGAKDFYRATNLSALPKIPKRKPDAQQLPAASEARTPTSPTPPALPRDCAQPAPAAAGGSSAARALLQPQQQQPSGVRVVVAPLAAAAGAQQATATTAAAAAPRSATSGGGLSTAAAAAAAHQPSGRPALLPTPPSPTLSPGGGGQARSVAAAGGASWLQPQPASGSLSPGAAAAAAAAASPGTTPLPAKQRKGSLNAVIDKLTSKSGNGGRPDEVGETAPSIANRASPAAAGSLAAPVTSYASGMPRLPPLHMAATNLRPQTPPSAALAARVPPPPLLHPPSRPSPTAGGSNPPGFSPQQLLRQNSGSSSSAVGGPVGRPDIMAALSAMQPPGALRHAAPAAVAAAAAAGRAGGYGAPSQRAATISPPNGKISRAPPFSPDDATTAPLVGALRAPAAIPTDKSLLVDGSDPASPQPQPVADAGCTRAIPLEEMPQQQPPGTGRGKGLQAAAAKSYAAASRVPPPGSAISARSAAAGAGSGRSDGAALADGRGGASSSSPQYSDGSPASSLDLIIHDPDDEERDDGGSHQQQHGAKQRGPSDRPRSNGSNRQSSAANGGSQQQQRTSSLLQAAVSSPSADCSSPAARSIDDELMDEAIACDTSITF